MLKYLVIYIQSSIRDGRYDRISTLQQTEIVRLENELKKRWCIPHTWNFKYNSDWESQIQFAFQNIVFEEIVNKAQTLPDSVEQYAINRWYNFWSDKAIHGIFLNHPKTREFIDNTKKNTTILIEDIPFQIRLHVFPYRFARTLRYALSHEEELVHWFYRKYKNNSNANPSNKIFVILYQRNGEHWRLKAEIQKLQSLITEYLDNFDIYRTVRLQLNGHEVNYADVIWCISQD